MRNTTFILTAALAVPFTTLAATGEYRVVDSFPSPLISPDGLEWDGSRLWTTQCQSTDNYALDPADGRILASTDTPFAIDHLAWDGDSMWATEAHTNRVHRLDATVSRSEAFIDAPTQVMGLTWADGALWVLDPDGRRFYPLGTDPTGGLPTPGDSPCGLGWDGQCFWAGDLRTRTLNLIEPETGRVVLTFDAPGGPGRLPTGFTWDGTHLWVNDEDPTQPTVYELDIVWPTEGPCARADVEEPQPEPEPDPGEQQEPAGEPATAGCSAAASGAGLFWPLLTLGAPFAVARGRRRS